MAKTHKTNYARITGLLEAVILLIASLMNKFHSILPVVVILGLVSCQQEKRGGADSGDQAFKQKGAEISEVLMKSLGSTLKAALKAGGPEQALTACHTAATPLTQEVSNKYPDARVSRISLKPRNPSNEAKGQDEEVLKEWQKMLEEKGEKPTDTVVRNSDTVVFYRPILIKNVCLKCHGDPKTFSDALRVKLAKLYPRDRAVGYSLGELRGAFRVEFAAEKK